MSTVGTCREEPGVARWWRGSRLALSGVGDVNGLGGLVSAALGAVLGRDVPGGARGRRRDDAGDDLVARARAVEAVCDARVRARARALAHGRGALRRRRAALAEQLR